MLKIKNILIYKNFSYTKLIGFVSFLCPAKLKKSENNSYVLSLVMHIMVFSIISILYYKSKNTKNIVIPINTSASEYVNIANKVVTKHIKDDTEIKENNIKSNLKITAKQKKEKVEKNVPNKITKQILGAGGNNTDIITAQSVIKDQSLLNYRPPVYPQSALDNNEEGIVTVRFLLTKELEIKKIVITKSSKYQTLDKAVVDTVPYWNIKRDISKDTWIEVTVNFKIQ